MKHSLSVRAYLTAGIALLVTSCATADHHGARHYHGERTESDYGQYTQYARVISAYPVYERISLRRPVESCHFETYETHHQGSPGGIIVGGLIGATIGNGLSHGQGPATIMGQIVGEAIGSEVTRNNHRVVYHEEKVCSTDYHRQYEERLVGYDVRYDYQGRIYQTRTKHHPGESIALAGRLD
jgi:uncharacterized protein YcfJ